MRRDEDEVKRTAALASVYLDKNRPDLALLLLHETFKCFYGHSDNFAKFTPTLQFFAPLCSVLFGNEEFLKFFPDPVSTADDGNNALELVRAALTILVGPFDLSPLSGDLYAAYLQRLVARVVAAKTPGDEDLTQGYLQLAQLRPVFIAAMPTFYMGDEQRRQAVMSVLPQLFASINLGTGVVFKCFMYICNQ